MWKKGVWFFSFSFFTSFILSEPNGSLMHLELSPVENSCGSGCETAQPTQHNGCPSPTSYTYHSFLPREPVSPSWLQTEAWKSLGPFFLVFLAGKINNNPQPPHESESAEEQILSPVCSCFLAQMMQEKAKPPTSQEDFWGKWGGNRQHINASKIQRKTPKSFSWGLKHWSKKHTASPGQLPDLLQREIISSKAATWYFTISVQVILTRFSSSAPEEVAEDIKYREYIFLKGCLKNLEIPSHDFILATPWEDQ